ncbi:MAG: tetratricopeptide repeat protein [Kofleriaceae bacterium]
MPAGSSTQVGRRPTAALAAWALALGTAAAPAEAPPSPASPRLVVAADPIPELPAQAPERFVVLPFENRSGVRALDWAVAGLPATIAEKLEQTFALDPAYGPLIVDGPAAPATPALVAARARAQAATYVITGWATRTNWELDLEVTLWRDAGGATAPLGTVRKLGPFASVHQYVGETLVELAEVAGWPVGAGALGTLTARPTDDFYAFTLLGRGLGRLTGALGAGGPIDPAAATAVRAEADVAAAERDLARAVFIDPRLAMAQRLLGEAWRRYPTDPRSPARAVGKFNYALDLAPTYVPALRAAAAAAVAAGKREAARDLYLRLLQRRPWDLDARFRLAEALWSTGDRATARRELRRVLDRDPALLAARRVLALIHAEDGDTRACSPSSSRSGPRRRRISTYSAISPPPTGRWGAGTRRSPPGAACRQSARATRRSCCASATSALARRSTAAGAAYAAALAAVPRIRARTSRRRRWPRPRAASTTPRRSWCACSASRSWCRTPTTPAAWSRVRPVARPRPSGTCSARSRRGRAPWRRGWRSSASSCRAAPSSRRGRSSTRRCARGRRIRG